MKSKILWLGLIASAALNLYCIAHECEEGIAWLPAETANWLEVQELLNADTENAYDSIVGNMGYKPIRYKYDTPGLYNSDTLWTAYVIRPTYELGDVPELFYMTASNEDTTYQLAAQGLVKGLGAVGLPDKLLNQ